MRKAQTSKENETDLKYCVMIIEFDNIQMDIEEA